MKLHLIRHGKAENGSLDMHDFDRKLAPKGIKQTIELGKHLAKHKGLEVWCSDALRTRETLLSLQKSCQFSEVKHFIDLYLCSQEDMLAHLWKRTSNDDLVIVGHNFGISDLLSYFTEEMLEMRTSEYYCLDFGDLSSNETSKGTAIIIDQYRPQV